MTVANVKYRLGGFFHEIHDLGLIQINLIDRGILVRGAVVIGDICHHDGLTFVLGLRRATLWNARQNSRGLSSAKTLCGPPAIAPYCAPRAIHLQRRCLI